MLSVIVDSTHDPAWNLALDEALVRSPDVRDDPGPPPPATLFRIWQNAPSVVVGRFQDVDRAVDLAGCAQDGVRVVRRASGGDAVYTGPGTLNFTLVRSPSSRDAHGTAGDTTQPPIPRSGAPADLDELVATAVERFGLPAAALRSGTVQTARLRTRHADLAHAAVHVTAPESGDRRYIAPDERAEQTCGSPPTLAELGVRAPLDEVAAAVLDTVADEFGILRARPPNALERACRDYLFAARYSDVTWHLMGGAGPSSHERACTGR